MATFARRHPLTQLEANSLKEYLKMRMEIPLSVVNQATPKVLGTAVSLITTWHRDNDIALPPIDKIKVYSTGGKSLWVDVGFLLEIN